MAPSALRSTDVNEGLVWVTLKLLTMKLTRSEHGFVLHERNDALLIAENGVGPASCDACPSSEGRDSTFVFLCTVGMPIVLSPTVAKDVWGYIPGRS